MAQPLLIGRLIETLRCLPGVGPKSAQRMAYHLLERNREGGRRLAQALLDAMAQINHCQSCRTLTQNELCDVCVAPNRDRTQLCIVETPGDVQALQQATGFQGLYYVLMGHLSPLDGIGPEELGLDRLAARFEEGEVKEIILATNATTEGEATAHYISEMARARGIHATRIAHGVPLGSELEFIDSGTLAHAFAGRREI